MTNGHGTRPPIAPPGAASSDTCECGWKKPSSIGLCYLPGTTAPAFTIFNFACPSCEKTHVGFLAVDRAAFDHGLAEVKKALGA